MARGTVGRPVTFSVDASEAGEGNLEITISARGLNIPTQVHPQGNARFAVSFVPAEACDHVVNVAFNKRPVSCYKGDFCPRKDALFMDVSMISFLPKTPRFLLSH